MSEQPPLQPSFLTSQRARLVALRTDLSRSMNGDAVEVRQVAGAEQGQASEFEDRAQDQTLTENDQLLSGQLGRERTAIDRALAKLDEGTYGFSDVSGLPIPIDRLKAFPQAVLTASEEPAP
jgi:DnaK suppressor protein